MSATSEMAMRVDATGSAMYRLVRDLYPICRSITGNGVRHTLARVREEIPLQVHEVPSGTPAFDWTIPDEWNIRDAYIKDASGRRIVDFQRSNLHVLNYSVPVHQTVGLEELKAHLFSLPDHPDWVPYRTSYYNQQWGFCVPHRLLVSLRPGDYEVCIDSTLAPGSLTYGEYCVPGSTEEEILVTCHVCHPSLCNDNLSGIALATELAKSLAGRTHRYTYRFLFIPGTIGSICWLSRNEDKTNRIRHGLVLACVGDRGGLTYKRSRRGNAAVDRAVEHVFQHSGEPYKMVDFSPYGYDERQFCSPGFNLAVGRFSRTAHGEYPEYHTSADNLDFVDPASLADSFEICTRIFSVLEGDRRYRNLQPKCEPQLGKRGLYRAMGGFADAGQRELAMLWVLNQSDGTHSLLDIAEKAGLPFDLLRGTADLLEQHGLLAIAEDGAGLEKDAQPGR